ncbi:hypothetical protein OKW33_007934 [Paraburkholderia atlantica]
MIVAPAAIQTFRSITIGLARCARMTLGSFYGVTRCDGNAGWPGTLFHELSPKGDES